MIKRHTKKDNSKIISKYLGILSKTHGHEEYPKINDEYNGLQFDHYRPFIENSGWAYNSSIIKFKNRIILAYRKDISFKDKTIYICELDKNFNPIPETNKLAIQKIEIPKPPYARFIEDPRLWIFNNNLYCSYTMGVKGQKVGFCLINDNLETIEHYRIDYGGNIEKNWQFFQHEGNLWFVYSILPKHIVLKLKPDTTVGFTASTQTTFAYPDNRVICGGTPPVYHKGRYWSFYHDRDREQKRGRIYGMGAYSFNPNPPFNILTIAPPFMHGDMWGGKRRVNDHAVIFPSGAYIENNNWFISVGYNDTDTRILRIRHKDIENRSDDVY